MNVLKLHFFSIGGFIIQIRLQQTDNVGKSMYFHDLIHRYFKGFIIESKSNKIDAIITIVDSPGMPTVSRNNETYSKSFVRMGLRKYEGYYHSSPYEFSQLLQIVVLELLGSQGFLLHASAILTKKGVVAFAGISGSGKSTTLTMVRNTFKVIADDSLIIRYKNDMCLIYQSPHIDSKHGSIPKTHTSFTLRSLFFIQKKAKFAVKKLALASACKRLYATIWTESKPKLNNVKAISKFLSDSSSKCYLLQRTIGDEDKLINHLSS